MSREQWGHGFYTGVEKGLKLQKDKEPRFIIEYTDNGRLNCVSIIHEKHGDVYTIEDLGYFSMLQFSNFGGCPSLEKEDIIPEYVRERKLSELENPKLFYSWATVMGEFRKWEGLLASEGFIKPNTILLKEI